MFAICSVPEFKPEPVNPSCKADKYNKPINMDHVITFETSSTFMFGAKKDRYPSITFELVNGSPITWLYESKEDRDEEYGKLLYKINKKD